MLAIYLLAKITKDVIDYGLENIRTESKIKAGLIYNYFDYHPHIKPYIKNKKYRSETVVVLEYDKPNQILDHFKKKISLSVAVMESIKQNSLE